MNYNIVNEDWNFQNGPHHRTIVETEKIIIREERETKFFPIQQETIAEASTTMYITCFTLS